MSDVACVFGPALEEVAARGVPAEELVAGLGVQPRMLGKPRKRIPWDAFAELIRRTSERLGPGVLEDLAALTTAQAVPALLRGALASWGDARPAFRMGARWWGPWIFRSTRAHYEELSDGRLREVIEILPGFRESPEFFQGVRGLLRATPLMFGQPEAQVDLEHDGRRGEFLIAPPPARARLGWRRRAVPRVLAKARPNGGPDREQLRASESRAKFATFLLAEKSRRLEALQVLGGQVTRLRGMQERVAAVVGLLEAELGVRGIRLGDDTPGSEPWMQSGDVSGPASATKRLAVAGRTVGWLELWARSEGGLPADDYERLDDLLPWIALALDDALTAEQTGQLIRMLAEDVTDWQLQERALEQALPHGQRSGGGDSWDDADSAPEPGVAILVVEDDAGLRARARRDFEAAGHAVFEAPSDPEALALEGPAVPIQLVVADWSSHALSTEFVEQIRRLHPELRGFLLLPLRPP